MLNKIILPYTEQEVIELTKQHIHLLQILKPEITYYGDYKIDGDVYRVFKSPKKYYCYKVKKIWYYNMNTNWKLPFALVMMLIPVLVTYTIVGTIIIERVFTQTTLNENVQCSIAVFIITMDLIIFIRFITLLIKVIRRRKQWQNSILYFPL